MAKILDSQWVRQANLLPKREADGALGISQVSITGEDLRRRRYTSASFKFTNGTLGGNFALNMPPQPCRYADPVPPRVIKPFAPGGPEDFGMSRWYSENIDDYSTLLHIRAGVPAYNSMFSFFSNFYSPDDARMVRTGRDSSIGSFIGRSLGWVFSIRLLPFIWTGQTIKYFTTVTSTRFAYLKPDMGTYWKYVNDIVNTIAANLDVTAEADASFMQLAENFKRRPEETRRAVEENDPNNSRVYGLTAENAKAVSGEAAYPAGSGGKSAKSLFAMERNQLNYYSQRLPEIYQSEGLVGINVYAVALRAQAMADAWNTALLEKQEAASTTQDNAGLIETIRNWIESGEANTVLAERAKQRRNIEEFLDDTVFRSRYGGLPEGAKGGDDGVSGPSDDEINKIASTPAPSAEQQQKNDSDTPEGTNVEGAASQQSLTDKIKQYARYAYESVEDMFDSASENVQSLEKVFKAAQHDGSQFLTLRVNGRESVSESFSNSTRESDIANMMNSTSASARNLLVNVADGKVADIPVLGSIANFVGDVISGAADSLRISGVGALMGNAFVDIPQHYDNSSAQFNSMSYTIQLRGPYGNDHNRIQNEILPLACLLALVLPRSAGASAYGIPFHCEAYCRGRSQIRFGIPAQLDITRGTANAPWTADGRYRGIEVRLTIKDLTSIMHMGMSEVSGWRAMDPTRWGNLIFPQDSAFTDYMSVLSSLGLGDQIYRMRKLKRNWRALQGSFEKWWSPQARAVSLFSGLTGQVLSSFSHGVRN